MNTIERLEQLQINEKIDLVVLLKHIEEAYNPRFATKGFNFACGCALACAARDFFKVNDVEEQIDRLTIMVNHVNYHFRHYDYLLSMYEKDIETMLENIDEKNKVIRIIPLKLYLKNG